MDSPPLRDQLRPALLDRLTDHHVDNRHDAAETPGLRRNDYQDSVQRDLAWLLNAIRLESNIDLSPYPEVRNSVVNFGLPAFSGSMLATLNPLDLEKAIHSAILRFEPRIDPASLEVKMIDSEDMTHHNLLGFRIRGMLWAQPYPIELLLRTQLDIDCGEFRLEAE
ncbi:type VI secretion system baseplate subunit TssE [Chitinimonas lacunae]|uniref:Type VI secretion system baseplate subunit TssE n=1 Tax=Chitinimonas lacunae TaxID=1963018 RepID=A0ABV8MTU1_9NEIS